MQGPRIVTRSHPHSRTMPAVLLAYFIFPLITPALTYPPDGSLRLSGYGSSALAGRLEVYLGGNWSAVCSTGFDYQAATVACKQMGLGSAVNYGSYPSNRYGANAGSHVLPGLVCAGTELHLLRCPRRTGNGTGCAEQQGAVIACSNISTPYNGEVRLVGGALPSEGTAELYYNYQWAPLCAGGFNWNVSYSLCRQMGYTGANVFRPIPNSSPPFWTPSYACDSHQTCISNCTSSLSRSPSAACANGAVWVQCSYDQMNGVPLTPGGRSGDCMLVPSVASNASVRLGGCGFPWCDPSVGRVELFYGNVWGTVCDSAEFTFNEASVICAQLGFNSASKIYRDNILGLGPGSGPIYSLTCLGVEQSIAQCPGGFTYSPTYANCDHYDDAVLQCSNAFPPYGSLMLDEGAGSAGALLMFTGQQYQAVCGTEFGMSDGLVACRQLGYPGVIDVKHGSYYNTKNTLCNTTWIFQCVGNESQLMACPTRQALPGECRPGLDEVGLICSTTNSSIENVYLTNSSNPMLMGILHVVLYGGESGVVCGDGFGQTEGQVACRQLGYGPGATVMPSVYTPNMGPVLISRVACVGFERGLDLCQYSLYAVHQCNTTAVLNCSPKPGEPDGSLRLLGGNATSGQLQMYLNGEWAGLCGMFFTSAAATIACHQLGLGTPLNYCTDGCVLTDQVNIYFAQYDCSGGEEALISCVTEEFQPSQCAQGAYVGLTCDIPALPTRTPFVVAGNLTTAPGFFLDIQPLYFYIIVSAGALLLILVVVVVVTLTCACLYRRRRQSGWSDPPVYDTPADNLPKELGKEHLGRIVIPSPLCLNVYEVESTLPPRHVEASPPPSYEEVQCYSSK